METFLAFADFLEFAPTCKVSLSADLWELEGEGNRVWQQIDKILSPSLTSIQVDDRSGPTALSQFSGSGGSANSQPVSDCLIRLMTEFRVLHPKYSEEM